MTTKKELIPTFDNKDKLADFLKATLAQNADLINDDYIEDINETISELYQDEADANYEDSYESSNC